VIPDGILTVIVTPYDDEDRINTAVLRRHVNWLIDGGVHAIIPGGTTGEYYAQTVAERIEVLETVAEESSGRVPLLAGTNSARPADTITLSLRARELGYQGLMLAAPFYSLPSRDDLADHFRHIASEVGLPILLYNFPARTGVDMDPEFLEKVADIEEVVAIKESSGSIVRLHELVAGFAGTIAPVCGTDDQALEYFLWGSRAMVAGAANFLPRLHVRLWEACVVERDFDRGQEMMRLLMPMFSMLEQGGKYIQYVKYGTRLAGFDPGPVRPPIRGLDAAERTRFERLLSEIHEEV
jgi:4-hydroxy-tetrahydrodipicolinate synthase